MRWREWLLHMKAKWFVNIYESLLSQWLRNVPALTERPTSQDLSDFTEDGDVVKAARFGELDQVRSNQQDSYL